MCSVWNQPLWSKLWSCKSTQINEYLMIIRFWGGGANCLFRLKKAELLLEHMIEQSVPLKALRSPLSHCWTIIAIKDQTNKALIIVSTTTFKLLQQYICSNFGLSKLRVWVCTCLRVRVSACVNVCVRVPSLRLFFHLLMESGHICLMLLLVFVNLTGDQLNPYWLLLCHVIHCWVAPLQTLDKLRLLHCSLYAHWPLY